MLALAAIAAIRITTKPAGTSTWFAAAQPTLLPATRTVARTRDNSIRPMVVTQRKAAPLSVTDATSHAGSPQQSSSTAVVVDSRVARAAATPLNS
jgi:hypothetical protein